MNIVFTIATHKYMPQAWALGLSVNKHNPTHQFIIALLDNIDNTFSGLNDNIKIIEVHKMGIEYFEEMRNRYNAFEMSCAMKPYVAHALIKSYNPNQIIYLDSDILCFGSFNLIEYNNNASFILTPHCTSPISKNDNHFLDLAFIKEGLYNAGFFALNVHNNESICILKWWMDKLRTECYVDVKSGRYVDQNWLSLLPIYFENVVICKDLGYNVALWNLNERRISAVENNWFINEKTPMIFFHFSGYNNSVPQIPSSNHHNFNFNNRKDLKPVFDYYHQQLCSAETLFQKNNVNYYKLIENRLQTRTEPSNQIFSYPRIFLKKALLKLASYL